MGGLLSTIGSWIKAGWDKAINALKWIWEKVSSLFGKITDLFRELMSCFSYTRERAWVQSGASRVEVGRDRITVGTNRDTLPTAPQQVDPSDKILVDKIKEGGPQMQKQLEDTLQVVTKMNKVVQEDEEHENPSQTAQKLRNLLNEPNTQNLFASLERQPTVNPALA